MVGCKRNESKRLIPNALPVDSSGASESYSDCKSEEKSFPSELIFRTVKSPSWLSSWLSFLTILMEGSMKEMKCLRTCASIKHSFHLKTEKEQICYCDMNTPISQFALHDTLFSTNDVLTREATKASRDLFAASNPDRIAALHI